MGIEFWGICLAIGIAIVLVSLLTQSRAWGCCLLFLGICALIGGWVWASIGGLGDNYDVRVIMGCQGFTVVGMGLLAIIMGAKWAARPAEDET